MSALTFELSEHRQRVLVPRGARAVLRLRRDRLSLAPADRSDGHNRHVRELPTVVTTSDTMETLYKNEPYIASRMLDQRVSKIYALTVPPYRGIKKR